MDTKSEKFNPSRRRFIEEGAPIGTAGGFALHGLPRVIVFGRIAGREAASANAS